MTIWCWVENSCKFLQKKRCICIAKSVLVLCCCSIYARGVFFFKTGRGLNCIYFPWSSHRSYTLSLLYPFLFLPLLHAKSRMMHIPTLAIFLYQQNTPTWCELPSFTYRTFKTHTSFLCQILRCCALNKTTCQLLRLLDAEIIVPHQLILLVCFQSKINYASCG